MSNKTLTVLSAHKPVVARRFFFSAAFNRVGPVCKGIGRAGLVAVLLGLVSTAEAGPSLESLQSRLNREMTQAAQVFRQDPESYARVLANQKTLQTLLAEAGQAQDKDRDIRLAVVSAALDGSPLALTRAKAPVGPRARLLSRDSATTLPATPNAADLAPTLDAPQTAAIQALARQLNNNPVEIVNWVQTHITPLPGQGSLQGAAGVLASGRGNATDIASLTLALLRAAGVPARYATGTIEITASRLQAWLGNAATPADAIKLLADAGIQADAQRAGGSIQRVRLPHTWVLAWVNAAPARGARNLATDAAGNAWIPVDGTYKEYQTQWPGKLPADLVGTLVGQTEAQAAAAAIQTDASSGQLIAANNSKLAALLTTQAQRLSEQIQRNAPDAQTLADVLGNRILDWSIYPLLSLSQPYSVVDEPGVYQTLPDTARGTLSLTLYGSAQDQYVGRPALRYTTPMVSLQGKHLSLAFGPADAASLAALQAQLGAPTNLSALPTRLMTTGIRLTGSLSVDGAAQASLDALPLGQTYYGELSLTTGNGSVDTRLALTGRVGETRSFDWDLAGNLAPELSDDRARLQSATPATSRVATQLHSLDHLYLESHNLYGQIAAAAGKVSLYRGPTLQTAYTWLDTELLVGVPVRLAPVGLALGESTPNWAAAPTQVATQAAGSLAPLNRQLNALGGTLAYVIPETALGGQGISAQRLFAQGLTSGASLWQITPGNLAQLSALNLAPGLGSRVQDLVANGSRVTVNGADVTLSDWQGRGLLVEDPASRVGTSFASGGLATASGSSFTLSRASHLGGARNNSWAQGAFWIPLVGNQFTVPLTNAWQDLDKGLIPLTQSLADAANSPLGQSLSSANTQLLAGLLTDQGLASQGGNTLLDPALWESLVGKQLQPGSMTETTPPTVTVTPGKASIAQGQSTTVIVDASDASGIKTVTLSADGGNLPLVPVPQSDGSTRYQATVTATHGGIITLTATATDLYGNTATATATLSVAVPGDTTPPTVSIDSPTDGADVPARIDIVGSVADANLARWRVMIAPIPQDGRPLAQYTWTELARGTQAVTHGKLASFDPGLVDNGPYAISLIAEDTGQLQSSQVVDVLVYGDGKPGQYSLTFEDLNVDMGSLPLTVHRTYDTRRQNQRLDFGYGWSVDYQDIDVRLNRTLGLDWELSTVGSGLNQRICVQPLTAKVATVRLPGMPTQRFDIKVEPACVGNIQFYANGGFVKLTFTPRSGTTAQLEATDLGDLQITSGTLFDMSALDTADPKSFKLTAANGTQYYLNRSAGLQQIVDRNGNTLSFDQNGIHHSAGKSLSFTRDSQGRITRITDPANQSLSYQYDGNGNLASVTDRQGNRSTLTYTGTGHLLKQYADPLGRLVARYEYDELGRLIASYDGKGNKVAIAIDDANRTQTTTDRNGNASSVSFDALGNITQETDALGQVTTYTYDANGFETSKTDPLGHTTRKTYDRYGNVLTETDPLGKVTTTTYTADNQVKSVTDALGRVSTNDYDPGGNLTAMTNAAGGQTTVAYVTTGELMRMTDPAGNGVIAYSYGSGHQDPMKGRLPSAGREGGIAYTAFAYDASNRRVGETTSRTDNGQTVTLTTTRTYDTGGNLLTQTDAQGQTTRHAYDGSNQRVSTTDPLNRTRRTQYDATGKVIRETAPDGSFTETRYDGNGNPTQQIDPLGRITTTTYDALNRPVAITNPDGATTTTTYDAAGRVTQTIDALGHTSQSTYDAAGRKTQETDARGKVTRYAYDAVGNLLTQTNALGQVTQYTYDALNRRTQTQLPDGAVLQVQYDAAGRKSQDTDPQGNTTQYAYDSNGRLTQVTDAQNQTTQYAYDEQGNKVSQTDALGHTTTWRYDNGGRVIERRLPGGQKESFTYDVVGNRLSHTDFNGQVSGWTYDLLDRVSRETRPDGSQVTYTYDAAGQLLTETDSRGTTTYTYDEGGRLATRTDPDSSSLTYAYDGNGRISQLTASAGGTTQTTQYTYDANGNLLSLTDPQGGQTTWTYDALNRKTKQTAANGGETTWTYDALGRVLTQETKQGTQSHARYVYTYDLAGKRTGVTETQGGQTKTIAYGYDSLNRLTEEKTTQGSTVSSLQYAYDAVGNRTQKREVSNGTTTATTTYGYDSNDRLISLARTGNNPTTYTWNADGSLKSQTQGTLGREYTWQKVGTEPRLKQVRLLQAGVEQAKVSYTLDAQGNRISRTLTQAGASQTTSFLVDRNRPYSETLIESTNGQVVRSQVFTQDASGDLLQITRVGQGTLFGEGDAHGNLRGLSDQTGALVAQGGTDAWGANVSGNLNTYTAHGYTGEWQDAVTGLQYNRARWYDSEMGRFVSMDRAQGRPRKPLSSNKYLYASADPINRRDPSGNMDLVGTMTAVEGIGTLSSITVPILYIGSAVVVGIGLAYLTNDINISMSEANEETSANEKNPADAVQRQAEYEKAKRFCDTPPDEGGSQCSGLSKKIDHAEKCVGMYEDWDSKWFPGRHSEKIAGWKQRIQNLKDEHHKKCTNK